MAYLQGLILVSLLMCIENSGAFQCPDGLGCSPCYSLSDGRYEIRCATSMINSMFIIKFKPNAWISVSCSHSPDWSEFHLGESQKLTNINEILFERCELPSDVKLAGIVKQLVGDELEELALEGNYNLTYTLNRNTLIGFQNITRLTLSTNQLMNVTDDLLDDFSQLTMLNLRENELSDLPEKLLNIPSLKFVELGSNRLEIIKNTTFKSLENLELLNLWNNRLVEIQPGSFDTLKSLKSIDMHTNNLTSLPANVFAKLQQLSSINLSQNNFSTDSLPGELFNNNVLLERIILIENKRNLTTLPSKFFANLRKLKRINIKGNKLVYLPEDLFINATSLQYLNIERNVIEKLPSNIFEDCEDLLSINLSNNKLSELPDGLFSTLRKLEQLDLSRNNLKTINRNVLDSLSSLQTLNLERNGLRTIHPDALRSLYNLTVAKLAFNQLTLRRVGVPSNSENRPMSPFSSCTKLEVLDLTNNSISDVFLDWTVLTSLRTLKLRYNKIQFLHAQHLMFLAENLNVDFSFNNIQRISLALAEKYALSRKYAKNVSITIDNNPIACDCDIYDLLRYREGKMHQNVRNHFYLRMENLKCHKPSWLMNHNIKELKSESLTCILEDPIMYDALCPESCECHLRPNQLAYIVNCSYRGLTEAPDKLRSPRGVLPIELNLTGNNLMTMPLMTQPGYNKVHMLLLSKNRIDKVTLNGLSDNLQSLALDSNNLTRLEFPVLNFLKNSTNLTNLTFDQNPWICDCDAREFLSFIQTERVKIPELQTITCAFSPTPIFEMTPEDLCPLMIGWIIAGCTGIALLSIVIGMIVALYYRYQNEIKVWLYAKQWCLWLVTEDELDKDKMYDAFISFSHEDEDFVMHNLVAKLEEGPNPFKLCIHYRDWIAGGWIPAQIIRSVEDSRRTIVILSPNFLKSVWGKMEFRTAHHQALTEGRARVIVILYGDIGPIDRLDPELKAYLTMNTYIKWDEPWFWDKLKYALPHNNDITIKSKRKKNKQIVFETQRPTIRIANDKSELIEETNPNSSTPPADTLKTFITMDNEIDKIPTNTSFDANTTVDCNSKITENCDMGQKHENKVKKPQITMV